jgi:hypothetical protein
MTIDPISFDFIISNGDTIIGVLDWRNKIWEYKSESSIFTSIFKGSIVKQTTMIFEWHEDAFLANEILGTIDNKSKDVNIIYNQYLDSLDLMD